MDRMEGSDGEHPIFRIGKRIPVQCSAIVKALIALRKKRRCWKDRILAGRRSTSFRIKKPFLSGLKKIRVAWYARDNKENELHRRTVADHTGEFVAEISFSSAVMWFTEKELAQRIDLLKK
ncbi:IclR family transcriptional regulator domain-containing protein [Evansella halocellulosilytica]